MSCIDPSEIPPDDQLPIRDLLVLDMDSITVAVDSAHRTVGIMLQKEGMSQKPAIFLQEKEIACLILDLQAALKMCRQLPLSN